MNMKFNKALYMLDMGKYDKGEELLKEAIQEIENPYELVQVKTCYAELLYEEDRQEEALSLVEELLCEDEYLSSEDRERLLEMRG